MAEKAHITRRAAFATMAAAAASTAALAVPAVAAIKKPDANDAAEFLDIVERLPSEAQQELLREARLMQLTRKFIEDAQAIDPTIKTGWIGNDMLPEHRGRIFSVAFDRRDPIVRRRKANT